MLHYSPKLIEPSDLAEFDGGLPHLWLNFGVLGGRFSIHINRRIKTMQQEEDSQAKRDRQARIDSQANLLRKKASYVEAKNARLEEQNKLLQDALLTKDEEVQDKLLQDSRLNLDHDEWINRMLSDELLVKKDAQIVLLKEQNILLRKILFGKIERKIDWLLKRDVAVISPQEYCADDNKQDGRVERGLLTRDLGMKVGK